MIDFLKEAYFCLPLLDVYYSCSFFMLYSYLNVIAFPLFDDIGGAFRPAVQRMVVELDVFAG